jgi:hypothetical protein
LIIALSEKNAPIVLPALEAIGPVAVPALVQAASGGRYEKSDTLGSAASTTLTRMRRDPKLGALATLMQIALHGWPPSVRHEAIRALPTLGQAALPALRVVDSEHKYGEDRTAVIEAFERMGALAVDSLAGHFSRAYFDESDLEIVASLGRIGEPAIRRLSWRLDDISKLLCRPVGDSSSWSTEWQKKAPERARNQANAIFEVLRRIASDEATRWSGNESAPAESLEALRALGKALLLNAGELRNRAELILRDVGHQAVLLLRSIADSAGSDEAGLAAAAALAVVTADGSDLVSRISSLAASISHEKLHQPLEILAKAGREVLPDLAYWLGVWRCSDCRKLQSRAIAAILTRSASLATPRNREHARDVSAPEEVSRSLSGDGILERETAYPVLEEAVCALAACASGDGRDAFADAWERAPALVRHVLKKALTGAKVRTPASLKKPPVTSATEALHTIKGVEASQILLAAFQAGSEEIRQQMIQATNKLSFSSEHRIALFKAGLDPRQSSETMRLVALCLQEQYRLVDSALAELKEALWDLDEGVSREAAAALSMSKQKGQLVLAEEVRLALVELIEERKKLFRERALPKIKDWISRPQVTREDEKDLRDLLYTVRDCDDATGKLVEQLAPEDQEVSGLLQTRRASAFRDTFKRLKMVDIAAEAFALHMRLVKVSDDWNDLGDRVGQRQRSALLEESAKLSPEERFVLFHDHREYELAVDALQQADVKIDTQSKTTVQRYLDCIGNLGRKSDYWSLLGNLPAHPQMLHKPTDESWAAFCRRAIVAIGWVQVHDTSSVIASGTGFCVSPDMILTCRHVLEVPNSRRLVDRERVRVLFPGDDRAGASNDPGARRQVSKILDLFRGRLDAILLQFDRPSPAWFRLGYSALVERGDEIAALGFSMPDTNSTVDHNLEFHGGKLSNIEPIPPYWVDAIKVGIEVGPGMSGAPVCNDLGEAIGILTLAKHLPVGTGVVITERLALLIDPVRDVIAARSEDGASS